MRSFRPHLSVCATPCHLDHSGSGGSYLTVRRAVGSRSPLDFPRGVGVFVSEQAVLHRSTLVPPRSRVPVASITSTSGAVVGGEHETVGLQAASTATDRVVCRERQAV